MSLRGRPKGEYRSAQREGTPINPMQALLLAIPVALAMLLAPASASAQQPIVIKFSHVVTVDTPKGKGAERFKQLAEERTKGRVKVEVYPNSSLFKDGEEMEALQLGSVQMLAPSLAKFGPLGVREFEVFDLPFMFDNYAQLHKVTDGPVGADAVEEAGEQGHRRPRLLGQRIEGDERQQAAAHARGHARAQDAHPVVEGAGRPDEGGRRHPAGDGVLRGLPGAADRRGRRLREHAVEHVHAEAPRGAEVHDRQPITATSATRSS